MTQKKHLYRYAIVMYQRNEMIFSRFIVAQNIKDAENFMAYAFPLYQQIAFSVDKLSNIDRFEVVRLSKNDMPQHYNVFDIEGVACRYSHSDTLKKFINFLIYGTL